MMNKPGKAIAVAALIAALATAALAQHTAQQHGPMDQTAMQKMVQDMTPQPSDPPSTKAYKEAQMKMMQGMHAAFSGIADVDFVRNMIPHHQGAIDMAKAELAHGKDPTLRKLAQKIIKDQEKEIAQMNDWLKKNAK
jgi:uncharacterized protein (DUF305 family)